MKKIFCFNTLNSHDWTVKKISDDEFHVCKNGIMDLKKDDSFIILDNNGICPIPNINLYTCFIATSNLSLHLPEGEFELGAETIIKNIRWK